MDAIQIKKDLIGMQDYMKNFARTLTKDEADAEDLTQDTTLRVLNNYDKFVDNVNFKGWVLKIMRNIFINNYHKLVRTQSFIDPNVDAYNVPLLSEGGHNTPEGSMDIKEVTRAKEAFSMFVAGYKYSEIAETLDIPLGTVKSRIFIARQELQKKLHDMR